MKAKIRKYYPEIIGGILCLSLGMLSGYSVSASDSVWYASLSKPPFNPPSWVFGPAWTILYLMMGASLGRLWKNKKANVHLIFLFSAQLIFNLLWSPIFFYYQSIGWALFDICALWVAIVIFMFAGRNQKPVLFLFIPYFLWVSFALILNFSIYQLNSV